MMGSKFTTGHQLAELETLNRAALDHGVQLPDSAAFALRLLRVATRRGYMVPPVTVYSAVDGNNGSPSL